MSTEVLHSHVVITGLLATDNPYPGLATARCLKKAQEFKGSLTGFIFDPLSTGAFCEGIFDRIFLVPYPAAGVDILLQRIREIHERHPIDLIIPSLDSEVILYAQIAETLAAMGIRTLLPSVYSIKLRSKNLLYEFCLTNGFRCPTTVIINNASEIRARCSDIGGTPFVLKGVLSDAAVCSTVEEADFHYEQLFHQWGYPIMMQSFITGEEIDVIALTDKKSQLAGAVVMKKFGLTEKGKAFAGITVEDGALVELTADIMKKLEWVGPSECEFIKDEKGGYHLMEINSRFPAWLYLAAEAGQNLPLMLVQLALDLPVPPLTSYQSGKLFIRTVCDTLIDAQKLMVLSASGEVIP
jgi:carbamoyl-phosphate synthase large subunit